MFHPNLPEDLRSSTGYEPYDRYTTAQNRYLLLFLALACPGAFIDDLIIHYYNVPEPSWRLCTSPIVPRRHLSVAADLSPRLALFRWLFPPSVAGISSSGREAPTSPLPVAQGYPYLIRWSFELPAASLPWRSRLQWRVRLQSPGARSTSEAECMPTSVASSLTFGRWLQVAPDSVW